MEPEAQGREQEAEQQIGLGKGISMVHRGHVKLICGMGAKKVGPCCLKVLSLNRVRPELLIPPCTTSELEIGIGP